MNSRTPGRLRLVLMSSTLALTALALGVPSVDASQTVVVRVTASSSCATPGAQDKTIALHSALYLWSQDPGLYNTIAVGLRFRSAHFVAGDYFAPALCSVDGWTLYAIFPFEADHLGSVTLQVARYGGNKVI